MRHVTGLTEREMGMSGTLVPSQVRPGWTPARSVSPDVKMDFK